MPEDVIWGVPIATIETILDHDNDVCPHWLVVVLQQVVNPLLPPHVADHAKLILALTTGTWRDVATHAVVLKADEMAGAFMLVPNDPTARTKAAVLESRVRELAQFTGPRAGCRAADDALRKAMENEHPYSMLALLDCGADPNQRQIFGTIRAWADDKAATVIQCTRRKTMVTLMAAYGLVLEAPDREDGPPKSVFPGVAVGIDRWAQALFLAKWMHFNATWFLPLRGFTPTRAAVKAYEAQKFPPGSTIAKVLEATAAQARALWLGWSPARHKLFPAPLRDVARLVYLIRHRIPHVLPAEMWALVLHFAAAPTKPLDL